MLSTDQKFGGAVSKVLIYGDKFASKEREI